MLESLQIHGFRGINNLTLDITSPITALSGLNGTGKSTIAQLAACAYKKAPTAVSPRFYVTNFFPVSPADPLPFIPAAQVIYSYTAQGSESAQQVTVSRKSKEWSGYKRQPERACYYIGVTQFIPKIERRDFSVYGGRDLELGDSQPLLPVASEHIQTILGLAYEELSFIEINHRAQSGKLAMATRQTGRRFSENHMGFGEGRIVYIVNAMETAPLQSLFVLEEPETSLHGDAQSRLAQYLVEVSNRRGHQLILTTHSAAILKELGRESVVYLRRSPAGELTATPRLSTYQIDSYLQKDVTGVTICVEDDFAKHLGIEIIRLCDSDFLQGCSFLPIGGGQEIPAAVSLLRAANLRVAGLIDGDMAERGGEDDGITYLPGSEPPEVEVFRDQAVTDYFAGPPYYLNVSEELVTVKDHHQFIKVLAHSARVDANVITTEACRAYVRAREPAEFSELVGFLKTELGDRR